MKRYIVTGGSGFIGFHLATFLASKPDTEVTVIDNHTRGIPDDMFRNLIAGERRYDIKGFLSSLAWTL